MLYAFDSLLDVRWWVFKDLYEGFLPRVVDFPDLLFRCGRRVKILVESNALAKS